MNGDGFDSDPFGSTKPFTADGFVEDPFTNVCVDFRIVLRFIKQKINHKNYSL